MFVPPATEDTVQQRCSLHCCAAESKTSHQQSQSDAPCGCSPGSFMLTQHNHDWWRLILAHLHKRNNSTKKTLPKCTFVPWLVCLFIFFNGKIAPSSWEHPRFARFQKCGDFVSCALSFVKKRISSTTSPWGVCLHQSNSLWALLMRLSVYSVAFMCK